MSFLNKGQADSAVTNGKKSMKSNLKTVSVRLDVHLAEFLNELSSSVGMKTQPFLSSIIEEYYYMAIADYIEGHSGTSYNLDEDSEGFFEHMDKDTDDFKQFILKLKDRFHISRGIANSSILMHLPSVLEAYEEEHRKYVEFMEKNYLKEIEKKALQEKSENELVEEVKLTEKK